MFVTCSVFGPAISLTYIQRPWKQSFLNIGFDGEFVLLLAFSKVFSCLPALCKTHHPGLAGRLQQFVRYTVMQKSFSKYFQFPFSKKTPGKTILFPQRALTIPYQTICAKAPYGGLDADTMWYSAVRKGRATTAVTVASAGPLNLEVSLINLCFIKESCKVKRVQLGWYPPQTINDADTFRLSSLRNSKSDLKASGGSDSARFQLRGCLNASTSIHIKSPSDTWAHCLELLMHTLEVCPRLPSPRILPCLVWFIYSFFWCLCSIFAHPLINYPDFSLFCLQDSVIIYHSAQRHSS